MDYSTIGTPMGNSDKKGKCEISMTKWRNMAHMLKDYYKAIEALKDCRKWLIKLENRAFVQDGLAKTQDRVSKVIEHFETMDGSN